jgi:lysophospholipase L1-like esterase
VSYPSRVGGARQARRAAVGGGGFAGLLGTTVGVLFAQAKLARWRVGEPSRVPFAVDGIVGRGRGDLLRMVMLGDSGAAGLGADDPYDTVSMVVASGLSAASDRPVALVGLAVVGARTSDLDAQVDRALRRTPPPDLAVIIIGANDVTHLVPPATSAARLEAVVRRLVDVGCAVVVGTCPDLGTIRPFPQPLRTIGRRWSLTLAAAQAAATEAAGGHAVPLAELVGPGFDASPAEYFSEDRFHPSSLGYRRLGEELLPAALDALQITTLTPKE